MERRERRRKEMVRRIMASKVESAMEELEEARRVFTRLSSYVRRRWGHYEATMRSYNNIVQLEVRQVWKDRKEKDETKIDHLEKKWGSRREEGREGRREEVLEGIRYKDSDLHMRAQVAGRQVEVEQAPLVYGGIRPTGEEAAVLALPAKFNTYGPVRVEEVEVETEVAIAKVKWELEAREERMEEDGTGGEWTERWEEEQQRRKQVYDMEAGRMDFGNKRVTDMKHCRRTFPPRPVSATKAAILSNFKFRVCEVTRGYMSDNCDERGNIKESNITREERAGLKSIQRKVKDQEWIVMPTDKSGRLTVNTKRNYLERMEPHMNGDTAVTLDDRHKMESEMNGRSTQWGRILQLGNNWNNAGGQHWCRVKAALRTRSCMNYKS